MATSSIDKIFRLNENASETILDAINSDSLDILKVKKSLASDSEKASQLLKQLFNR